MRPAVSPDHRLAGRAARWAYRVAAYAAILPLMGYMLHRARRDPDWRRHWSERLGGGPTPRPGAVWVHAVSLGEMRAAIPLVRALLDRGDHVVTTHLTPAGRREALRAFGPDIAAGRMAARYVPFEAGWCLRRFLHRQKPRLGLVIEQEIWPGMIEQAARQGVALFLANSQITHRGFRRALRLHNRIGHPVAQVAGVMAKSPPHAENFRALGVQRVIPCGELRFDQPVPAALIAAARALRAEPAAGLAGRAVVTFASVVAGEEDIYLDVIARLRGAAPAAGHPPPLVIFVPRAIERFDHAARMIEARGLQLCRRSRLFGPDLTAAPRADAITELATADVVLGDSMGEMFYFLELADAVVTGGGFLAAGAHNVIEPLLLGKPVLVGPTIWTIEYPAHEAEAEGVLDVCPDAAEMASRLAALLWSPARQAAHRQRAARFLTDHTGATARILDQAEAWLTR